ncbi:hypothetical protein KOR42_31890 [Thalassoglobus neptunius]|uniref:Uncharacterized protein n=1 Tax=Thalassoglobus neptunius TaxID=1938619 RepID=A0A5C5WQM5_9PLAN|nr:hypothetical protein KOR42_31890 [Thalassoglobus neptunius]
MPASIESPRLFHQQLCFLRNNREFTEKWSRLHQDVASNKTLATFFYYLKFVLWSFSRCDVVVAVAVDEFSNQKTTRVEDRVSVEF